VQNGLLTYGYNYVAEQFFRVRSSGPIPAGHHIVSAEFTPTGAPDLANGRGTPAKVVLFVDGEPVPDGDLPDHKLPFAYGGRIKRALVDVSGTPVDDLKERMRQILARQ
jgi:arylsulfatase